MSMTVQQIIDTTDLLIPNSLTTAQKITFLNAIQRQVFRVVDFPNLVAQTYLTSDVAFYNLPSDCQADRLRHLVYSDGTDETEYDYKNFSVRVSGSEDQWYSIYADTQVVINPTPDTSGGTVSGVTVDEGGSGYTSATISFSGGGGSGAAGTVTVSGGRVTGVTMTANGTNYSTAPTGTIAGNGSGATVTVSINEHSIYFYYAPSPTDFSASALTVTPSTPADFDEYYVYALASRIAAVQRDVALKNNFESDAQALLAQMIRYFSDKPDASFQQDWSW